VNHLGQFGRWAFAEFTEVYEIEKAFGLMIESAVFENKSMKNA